LQEGTWRVSVSIADADADVVALSIDSLTLVASNRRSSRGCDETRGLPAELGVAPVVVRGKPATGAGGH
jgi:hypothetical protein